MEIKDEDEEIWRNIPGYENYYVSSLGRVMNINYKRQGLPSLLKPSLDITGYPRVTLYTYKERNTIRIHRLVVELFPEICGKVFKGYVVDHLNRNRSDNRAVNLRVCTQKQNINNPLTKEIMKANAKKPRYYSTETRRKLSVANKGKIFSTITRNKMSKAKSKPVIQLTKNGEFIKTWDSATKANSVLGIATASISSACRGKLKTAGGFCWKFLE